MFVASVLRSASRTSCVRAYALSSQAAFVQPLSVSSARRYHAWSAVPQGPPDPILGVTVAYNNDPSPKKVNLGVGAYRDDEGKPFVLSCVSKAEKALANAGLNHEYAPICGVPSFKKHAANLIFGEDSPLLKDGKVASVQTISGTGALSLVAAFFKRFMPEGTKCYLPRPSWGNHRPVFNDAGLEVGEYGYYNPATCGLDFDGMVADIKNLPARSIVLLHSCAQNPTGVDPSLEQWEKLAEVMKEKEHFALMDTAYQGFASGDPERDVAAVRLFAKKTANMAVCQSFAKNFGLYGERIGALHFVTQDAEETERVMSQLKIIIRPQYSNPPIYGARLVSHILADPELTQEWRKDVRVMADRIISMRTRLRDGLLTNGSQKNWDHITNQIGMFCFSGLTAPQVERLKKEFSIYLTSNGRISMAGVTSKNVDYLAAAMHEVTKE